MGFLRRLFGGRSQPATPADLLDWLQANREAAEAEAAVRHPVCPECGASDVRVGTWVRGSQGGWTVTCAVCGTVLEETTEVG